MPTVTHETLAGKAWCNDPLCVGNEQEDVAVVLHTTLYTYTDSGGDLPGIEKSFAHFTFAEDADCPCPACGKPRACDVQERPSYPTSQWAQDGLLTLLRQGKIKPAGEPLQSAQAAQNSAEIDELKAQLAELKALVADQPARRGPGRPRKEEVTTDGA